MDRLPKPAPFPVGTRLRYIGTSRVYADRELLVPLQVPGMEVVVNDVRPGRRGTLRQLYGEEGAMYDEGPDESLLDRTSDAYSVWTNANGRGRIIWPDHAHEWERV